MRRLVAVEEVVAGRVELPQPAAGELDAGRQVGRLPVVGASAAPRPGCRAPPCSCSQRATGSKYAGGGRGIADAAGDLADARGHLPVEAAGHEEGEEPDRDPGPAGEHDRGQHRPAEEGAEPHRVLRNFPKTQKFFPRGALYCWAMQGELACQIQPARSNKAFVAAPC